MDPVFLTQLFNMLGLGSGGATAGAGGAGGAGGGTMPPAAGVPYGTESAGTPTMGIPGSQSQPSIDPTTGQPTGAPAMPSPPTMRGGAGVPYGGQSQTMSSLGEALTPQPAPGTPMPMPRPTGLGAPVAPTPGYFGGSPETNPNLKPIGSSAAPQGPTDIAKLLGGIKQPQGPDVVKPSTPAAHQTKAIGPSDLMALLASLGMGGHRSQRTPTTLGQALELKPSAWGGMYG